jgi:protein TonB
MKLQSQSTPRVDTSAGHLSLGLGDHGGVAFQFAAQPQRAAAGFALSFALQAGVLLLVYLLGRAGLQVVGVIPRDEIATPELQLVFKAHLEGPGGGGGGGGNRMPDPPRKAEAKGEDRITVPVAPEVAPIDAPEPVQLAQIHVPVKDMSSGLQDSLGAIQAIGPLTVSRGPGRGGGAGSGVGIGIGPGDGPGIGPGKDGGTGGDVYRPGSGVTDPDPYLRPEPQYTPEAMLARIQGEVLVECIVRPNGVCTDAHVLRAPDPALGLDRAALKAVEQWRFRPGRRGGQPVSVQISIALDFSLR